MTNQMLKQTTTIIVAFFWLINNSHLQAQVLYFPASISQPNELTVSVGPDTTLYAGSPLLLYSIVQGGVPAYSYLWRPNSLMIDSTNANTNIFALLGSTTYTCLVTDANGCTTIDSLTVNGTFLSVEEFSNSGVVVYPNPANDVLYLKRVSQTAAYKVQISDASGRKMLEHTWPAGESLELNLEMLASGMYILQLESGAKTFQQKITIQK